MQNKSAPGAKKFVIKPFRPNSSMDNSQAVEIWSTLAQAIREVYDKNASSLSFEELYRSAYSLVLHKHGSVLYKGVVTTMTSHMEKVASIVTNAPDDQLLPVLQEQWADHSLCMLMVRDILMYMDRTFCTQSRKTTCHDMGLHLFHSLIIQADGVKERLKRKLLDTIAAERMGELIDRELVKKILGMLVELGVRSNKVYETEFETLFLEATQQFYAVEANDYLDQNTCPDYLRKASARLSEESSRVTWYLHASTEPKLKAIMEKELIENKASALVEMEGSGCRAMIRDDKLEDLSIMFSLFSRVPFTLKDVRVSMHAYVRELGNEAIERQKEVKDAVKFVQELLDIRDKFIRVVSDAFKNDRECHKQLKSAFEEFMNKDSMCSRYLAQYVDDLLRGGMKGMNEDDIDARLEKVIILFRYLQDKDVFESFYKRHLSKRLLSGRSRSDDIEKLMIAKLKTECGCQFTAKLEGMFKDMKMAKDTMKQYKETPNGSDTVSSSYDLCVNVLTSGFWPIESVEKCILPDEVTRQKDMFEAFYLNKHSERRLFWQTDMGNADIRAKFDRRYDLAVSTYQMCILLLFNGPAAELSFAQIQAATEIPEDALKRQIISLCTPKARILLKSSKGKAIEPEDTLKVNENFTSKLLRVRVPMISVKDSSIASSKVPEAVAEDRKHLIEAAIVRIMKARKSLQHNNLVLEVSRQVLTRFKPAPQMIKQRIESLIEREYLERSSSDRK